MIVQPNIVKRRSQVERKNEAEEALLDAAQELFAERGIFNTSLAQIGERAGYSRGLVNHHFGSKDALIDRLARRAQERFVQHLDGADHANGLDAVLAAVDAYLMLGELRPKEGRSFLVMWGASFPEQTPVAGFPEADLWSREQFARSVRRGQKDGSINPTLDAISVSVFILGLVRGVASQYLIAGEGLEQVELRKQCQTFVTAALSQFHKQI